MNHLKTNKETIKDSTYLQYEDSLNLKKIGYDEYSTTAYFSPNINSIKYLPYYHNNSNLKMGEEGCISPNKWEAHKWFRDVFKLTYQIYPIKQHWECDVRVIGREVNQSIYTFEENFESYEEAELACLRYMIDMQLQITELP